MRHFFTISQNYNQQDQQHLVLETVQTLQVPFEKEKPKYTIISHQTSTHVSIVHHNIQWVKVVKNVKDQQTILIKMILDQEHII